MMELGNIVFGHSRGEHHISRSIGYEDILYRLFDKLNISDYGEDYETDIFEIHPYCWCGDDNCPQCGENITQFNFYYKPDDLKISWYKYPLRDAYSNKKLSIKYFDDIIEKCIDSLGRK